MCYILVSNIATTFCQMLCMSVDIDGNKHKWWFSGICVAIMLIVLSIITEICNYNNVSCSI